MPEIDPSESDMRAYSEFPSLGQQLAGGARQQPPPKVSQQQVDEPTTDSAQGGAGSSSSPSGQGFSFGDMGIDPNTQMLEAILVELRTLNQNIRGAM